ncbi:hypothetical protein DL766_004735 [Monosporascus sp. MC13-8B]|uniref:F-box domain-containing protein n=1 Tax=Monosporascus cannonballus TaxID=155416 RepID=A0ABY0H4J3_9PEZI|nr:hypothetical protein DL762_006658 [Monosporascus cannonballus]RYO88467.1 hypothetical protein DL763_005966 [Monosporascus cannonballus]RYP30723.1 hypothetical protein DL766_004735 [Monosporascus sp. MC13-8B]
MWSKPHNTSLEKHKHIQNHPPRLKVPEPPLNTAARIRGCLSATSGTGYAWAKPACRHGDCNALKKITRSGCPHGEIGPVKSVTDCPWEIAAPEWVSVHSPRRQEFLPRAWGRQTHHPIGLQSRCLCRWGGDRDQVGLEDRAGDAYPAPTATCTSRHRLAALPQEILQQILGYLVPRGSAYQFFYAKHNNKPVTVVQQFIPANEHGLRSAHLALAGTSRYWRDVVYSMLYGINMFVFNIGTTTMETSVESHDFKQFESWVRVLSEEHSGPLGPMSQATAKYLKSAILLFAFPISLGSKEASQLADVVARAARMLESAAFSKLQIHLQALGRISKAYDTILVDSLDVDFCGTTNVMQVKLRDPKVVPPSSRSNKVQRAFEPLLKLKAVGEPLISGLVAEDFAQEMKDNITVARPGA